MITPEIIKSNNSVRSRGAVGKGAKIPQLVKEMFSKDILILDFGSGPDQIHANDLKLNGFNVHAFDFGKNWREGMQYEVFPNRYDLIYASNVINTWSNVEMFHAYFADIAKGLVDGGKFLCNYPNKPRYSNLTDLNVEDIMGIHFKTVNRLQKNIWLCAK